MNPEKMIPVECPDAMAMYDEQTVQFHILHHGKSIPVTGVFHVKLQPTRISIEVDAGFDGKAFHVEEFHLPQEAVDMIRLTDNAAFRYEVSGLVSHILPRR